MPTYYIRALYDFKPTERNLWEAIHFTITLQYNTNFKMSKICHIKLYVTTVAMKRQLYISQPQGRALKS